MCDSSNKENEQEQYELVGEFVSIFLRGQRWYVNLQHQGQQVRRTLKTKSKKEARRRALLLEKEILAGEYKSMKRAPLIAGVVDQYNDYLVAEGCSSKTISKYRVCFRLLLEFADCRRISRISQIDVAFVDYFRAERTRGGEGRRPSRPKTVHNDTVTIRQLVNFALKRGLISEDPLKDLMIKKPRRTPQPCWSREQVDQIIGKASSPHLEPLVFLAETGTRVGEAKWLTWEDIDCDRRLIFIRPKDGWIPKSGDERVVPMSDRVYQLFDSMTQTGRWVFSARVTARYPEEGRQISERRLLTYLKRILGELGFSGHLHTFRHSFISFAAISGVAERVLRQWIGHVDREILDWYFHLADRESQEAMQRLSKAAEKRKQIE